MPSEEMGQLPWVEAKGVDWNEIQFGGEGTAQWSDGVLHLEAGVAVATAMRKALAQRKQWRR